MANPPLIVPRKDLFQATHPDIQNGLIANWSAIENWANHLPAPSTTPPTFDAYVNPNGVADSTNNQFTTLVSAINYLYSAGKTLFQNIFISEGAVLNETQTVTTFPKIISLYSPHYLPIPGHYATNQTNQWILATVSGVTFNCWLRLEGISISGQAFTGMVDAVSCMFTTNPPQGYVQLYCRSSILTWPTNINPANTEPCAIFAFGCYLDLDGLSGGTYDCDLGQGGSIEACYLGFLGISGSVVGNIAFSRCSSRFVNCTTEWQSAIAGYGNNTLDFSATTSFTNSDFLFEVESHDAWNTSPTTHQGRITLILPACTSYIVGGRYYSIQAPHGYTTVLSHVWVQSFSLAAVYGDAYVYGDGHSGPANNPQLSISGNGGQLSLSLWMVSNATAAPYPVALTISGSFNNIQAAAYELNAYQAYSITGNSNIITLAGASRATTAGTNTGTGNLITTT